MKTNISTALSKQFGRKLYHIKASSPKLLFGVGIIGVIGSTILACRATLRLPSTMDDIKDRVDELKKLDPDDHTGTELVQYSKNQYNRDMVRVYAEGTFDIVKLYGPAFVLGSVSIAALTSSHISLTRRNAALTSAYSALHASYDAYRRRVKAEVGEQKELDIYQNATYEKVTIDGKVEEIRTIDPNAHSQYARFFDEASTLWQKNAELNLLTVRTIQNYFNDLLQVRKFVFLNEVYNELGLEISQAGQCVGWVLNDKGDNYIDFGIYTERNARFVNRMERSVLLDFNVDGVILDKIPR